MVAAFGDALDIGAWKRALKKRADHGFPAPHRWGYVSTYERAQIAQTTGRLWALIMAFSVWLITVRPGVAGSYRPVVGFPDYELIMPRRARTKEAHGWQCQALLTNHY